MQSKRILVVYDESLSANARAKINLGLRVSARRSDGFHDIDTVFVAFDWCDRITVGRSASISMSCTDNRLPIDGRNLCIRAANTLRAHCGIDSGAHIHLEKQIPYGAGLGGGSSDAATVLNTLNRVWKLGLSHDELENIGLDIGSDVPFFIRGIPSRGRGRGELLEHWPLPAAVLDSYLAVVNPGVHISTAQAFAGLTPSQEPTVSPADVIATQPIESWKEEVINDFEPSVFAQYPDLRRLKKLLYDEGALFALMSGSGSALYGLFSTRQEAVRAISSSGMTGWCGQLSTA